MLNVCRKFRFRDLLPEIFNGLLKVPLLLRKLCNFV
ncbi:protein of unknown function [Methylorubrum extorquens]|uniref:Uncharacterized protein n=1 Tax=Methylorubrum extorquens TaxID=408 RepID=A0A2N9AM52_METEX|nr:protein of unknown function [Methylorubrum extorquens]